MNQGAFVALHHFMPGKSRVKHRFWDNFYSSKMYEKYNSAKRDKWFPKARWREQGSSVNETFYAYLMKNFPNPIPVCLFFYGQHDHVNYIADKWLEDILSGESFYARNKFYFTKAEVKEFLTCEWEKNKFSKISFRDLIIYFYNAKIKANNLDFSAEYFTDKIGEKFTDRIANEYFWFICRYKDHVGNHDEIGDIWDFVQTENNIDFENMTWQQLRNLSEEWHYRLDINYRNLSMNQLRKIDWKGTGIEDFNYSVNGVYWEIKEITTAEDLYYEGKEMNHCVFNYLDRCIKKNSIIFSVKKSAKFNLPFQHTATLELTRNYKLVQAKGQCNKAVKGETAEVIRIWAKENGIKCEHVFGG